MRKCNKCGESFPNTDEFFYKAVKGGYCKTCWKTIQRERYHGAYECSRKQVRTSYTDQGLKICSECKFELDPNLNNFFKNNKLKDGLTPHCKACKHAYLARIGLVKE